VVADRTAAHGKARRSGPGDSGLKFKRVVDLRLNSLGRRLLACGDVAVRPLVTVHRWGTDLHTFANLVQLLRSSH
jgi:hypothetical protein